MRVLIAEDNRFFRRLLEANLKQWGHEIVACEDGEQAWGMLQTEDAPKLAILDWEMPKMQGIEVCREVRKQKNRPYLYIIILTAKTRKEDLIEGLEAGADDYITKPFDPYELRVRVRAATRIVQLQEDLLAAFRAAEIQAKEDPLTKIWNHSTILELLQTELDRSMRQNTPVSVIMADVDCFKQVNDGHGHQAGDRVLTSIAKQTKSMLRSYDSVGRYGGDEFLIILPGCGEEHAVKLAQRLCDSIATPPAPHSGKVVQYSMSFGVYTVAGASVHTVNAAVRAADQALYAAKEKGRNRVEVWRADLVENVQPNCTVA